MQTPLKHFSSALDARLLSLIAIDTGIKLRDRTM
jgi:hypothetical protein